MPGDRGGRKPSGARQDIDDHHPARPIELGDDRRQLPDPQQVEENVQQAGVEPARAEDGPPPGVAKHGHGSAGPKEEDGVVGWGHEPHDAAPHHQATRRQQGQGIKDHAEAGHERDKPEIVAEAPEGRGKAPEARVPPAAVVAGFVVDADQVAARHAHD